MSLLDWQTASSAFVSLALGTVMRSLILASVCGLAVWLLRSRTAALRFMLWKWTLLALFVLPFLISLTPPVPKAAHALAHIQLTPLTNEVAATTQEPATYATPIKKSRVSIILIPPISLFVTLLLLARLAYTLLQLLRIATHSHFIPDPRFHELAHDLWLQSGGGSKPRFAVSHGLSVPVTFNTASDAWIFLPPGWSEWEEPKLRAVLTHELAHVQRADSATLLLASFATCLFWFHPLSWFLQRQLSRLAEEACDEVVLATAATPEQYAQFLIAFAKDVQHQQGRIAIPATAVVRKSNLQKRMERLFTQTRPLKNWFTVAFFALFVGTLYLTAAARFSDPPTEPSTNWEPYVAFSPTDVENIESAINANPDQVDLRMQLAVFFGHQGQEQPFTSQMLWLIKHHPSLPALAGEPWFSSRNKPLSDAAHNQIRAAWEDAVTKNPNSSQIILNAASFIERTDQVRGLDLLRRAQALGPAQRTRVGFEIATIYAAAEMQGLGSLGMLNNIQITPESGAKLRAELAGSQDPALLTATGRLLAQFSLPLGNRPQQQRGIELIQRAVTLDLTNPEWKRALQLVDLAQTLSTSSPHPEATGSISVTQGSGIILSPDVAEANLVNQLEPIYPSDALAAHIQGIVEFTATVGPEGTITQLQLVRGHPSLVNAAKDAVLKYLYHPATQNGQPIPFVTEVLVSFKIPD